MYERMYTWKNVKFSSQYKSKKRESEMEMKGKERINKHIQVMNVHVLQNDEHMRYWYLKKTHSFIEHHVQYILTHNRSHSHARTCSDYIVSIFFALYSLSHFLRSLTYSIWYFIKLNMVSCAVRTWTKCSVKKGFVLHRVPLSFFSTIES